MVECSGVEYLGGLFRAALWIPAWKIRVSPSSTLQHKECDRAKRDVHSVPAGLVRWRHGKSDAKSQTCEGKYDENISSTSTDFSPVPHGRMLEISTSGGNSVARGRDAEAMVKTPVTKRRHAATGKSLSCLSCLESLEALLHHLGWQWELRIDARPSVQNSGRLPVAGAPLITRDTTSMNRESMRHVYAATQHVILFLAASMSQSIRIQVGMNPPIAIHGAARRKPICAKRWSGDARAHVVQHLAPIGTDYEQ